MLTAESEEKANIKEMDDADVLDDDLDWDENVMSSLIAIEKTLDTTLDPFRRTSSHVESCFVYWGTISANI
jgi:hypothetical protein